MRFVTTAGCLGCSLFGSLAIGQVSVESMRTETAKQTIMTWLDSVASDRESIRAELVVRFRSAVDETSPIIENDRAVAAVVVEHFKMRIVGSKTWEGERRAQFTLDQSGRTVLRCVIDDPARPGEATPEPPRSAYLRDMGEERWLGPVQDFPVVNLHDALKATHSQDLPGFVHSARTVIHLVQWRAPATIANNEDLTEQRAVWLIDCRGIPPLRPDRPTFAVNHLRHVVDAKTGTWLFASTEPQPLADQIRKDSFGFDAPPMDHVFMQKRRNRWSAEQIGAMHPTEPFVFTAPDAEPRFTADEILEDDPVFHGQVGIPFGKRRSIDWGAQPVVPPPRTPPRPSPDDRK